MAEHVLGITIEAETTEKGYFSPSITAGLPVPFRWDTAATSIHGTALGLHKQAWALCVYAVPESPPCYPSTSQTQQGHPLGAVIPRRTAPAPGGYGADVQQPAPGSQC